MRRLATPCAASKTMRCGEVRALTQPSRVGLALSLTFNAPAGSHIRTSLALGRLIAETVTIVTLFARHYTRFIELRWRPSDRGVEALGEPAVDFREHRARLLAFALFSEQPCETDPRA